MFCWYVEIIYTDILQIKKLITIYLHCKREDIIDLPMEILRVHHDPDVVISRKSLKHFVESRILECNSKMLHEDMLVYVFFIIDSLEKIFTQYDVYDKQEENKYIYIKHYWHLKRSSVRVIAESVQGVLQIKTMHYQKYRKPNP